MDEPSVLDYVKAKLKFWEKTDLRLPTTEESIAAAPQPADTIFPDEAGVVQEEILRTKVNFPRITIPVRSIAAILLAIIGQGLLEPPKPLLGAALALYLAAIALLIWSAISNEWTVSDNEDIAPAEWPRFKMRWQFLLAGSLLAGLAYVAFNGYVFDFLNLTLWIASFLCFLLGFLDLDPIKTGCRDLYLRIKSGRWQIHLTWWSILVLFTLVLIVIFRTYQLNMVPPEMTSDHAEKLMDIQDVMNGQWTVYFTRNTGREAFQFYLTALIIKLFHTGLSFISLKIGMVAAGLLTLPYLYLLAKEFWNRRVALLALIFAGIAFWPNVISRVGLRFALYPLFTAPALYYLLKGLKNGRQNDFIWAGIAIGLGMHGYSPYRVVPILLLFAVFLYILHRRNHPSREKALTGTIMMGITAIVVTLPLIRYAVDNPDIISYRLATRMSGLERPIPGNPIVIFFDNLKNAMLMFGVSDGSTWLHSIPYRPALDVITATLFYLGMALLLYRYIRFRRWTDLFFVLSVPILMLPSILSIAFPEENPVLNRTAGAIIPVYLIIAVCLDGFLAAIEKVVKGRAGSIAAFLTAVLMVYFSARQNYNLLFDDYLRIYQESAGNTSEMGQVIRGFAESVGTPESAWVVGFPYWVDTRLVSIEAGYPIKDYAIWPENFGTTKQIEDPKLFILNPQDQDDLKTLLSMYPSAKVTTYISKVPGRDFLVMLVGPGN